MRATTRHALPPTTHIADGTELTVEPNAPVNDEHGNRIGTIIRAVAKYGYIEYTLELDPTPPRAHAAIAGYLTGEHECVGPFAGDCARCVAEEITAALATPDTA